MLYVDHDQVGGCREMTNLLLMKGLHRIALLGGSMLYTVNQTRLEGFRQAHEHSRCKIDETLLFLELETDDLRIDAIQQAVARQGGLPAMHGRPRGHAGTEHRAPDGPESAR